MVRGVGEVPVQSLSVALMLIGVAIMVVGGVVILFAAFRQSVLWGLAYFFIPFAALVFWIQHWDESKTGFKFKGIGLAVLIFGAIISGFGAPAKSDEVATAAKAPVSTSNTAPSTYSLEAERARLNLPAYELEKKNRREVVRPPVTVPEVKKFEQVWADTATKTYYADGCKKLPPNAYRVAKSAVKAQGFSEASCR